jgi:hypothetical protein
LLSRFLFFDIRLKRPKNISRTFLNADFLAFGSESHTLRMVNSNTRIVHRHGLSRAYFGAQFAGNASGFADRFHDFAGITGTAGNPNAGL